LHHVLVCDISDASGDERWIKRLLNGFKCSLKTGSNQKFEG
jgi:hypothetical protein